MKIKTGKYSKKLVPKFDRELKSSLKTPGDLKTPTDKNKLRVCEFVDIYCRKFIMQEKLKEKQLAAIFTERN